MRQEGTARLRLGAYVNQLPGCEGPKSFEKRRNQRGERLDSVRGRDENDDGNWEGANVLLMFQILICCHQGVEVAGGHLKQLTVSLAGPPHLSHRPDFMGREQPRKRTWQRFIEQEAHRLSASLWP